MKRRLQVIIHWIKGRKNGVSFFEITKFFFGRTCVPLAKSKIRKIGHKGDYMAIYLKNIQAPLYYPKNIEIEKAYQIITEMLYPDDWHFYELPQTKVESDDVVVDCGAAEGLFSLLVADRCNKVYAIDPLPEFIDAMKLTFRSFQNVEILQVALSDEKGELFMSENSIHSSLSEAKTGTAVAVETLDNLFYKKGIPVNYLKADLEGYDYKMLKGAIETIKKNKPKISITTYHNKEDCRLITDLLKNIEPSYNILLKGIEERAGAPVMLHAWVDK